MDIFDQSKKHSEDDPLPRCTLTRKDRFKDRIVQIPPRSWFYPGLGKTNRSTRYHIQELVQENVQKALAFCYRGSSLSKIAIRIIKN